MTKVNCCYKCGDRIVGCHSNCSKYKKYRNELDRINENRRKDKDEYFKYKGSKGIW